MSNQQPHDNDRLYGASNAYSTHMPPIPQPYQTGGNQSVLYDAPMSDESDGDDLNTPIHSDPYPDVPSPYTPPQPRVTSPGYPAYLNQPVTQTYQPAYDPYTNATQRPISPLPALPQTVYAISNDKDASDIYDGHEDTYPLTSFPQRPGMVEAQYLGHQPVGQYISPSPHDSYDGSYYSSNFHGGTYDLNTYDDAEDEEDYTDDEDLQGYPEDQEYYQHEHYPENILSDGYAPTSTAIPFQGYPREDAGEDQFEVGEHPLLPAEGQQPRRHLTTKRVRLFRGNLVLDCPVASELLKRTANTGDREFTHMRYSAATTTPTDFPKMNFTLRQRLYTPPRQTELFIVVTIYNEDDILLARTLKGVFENVYHFCKLKKGRPGAEVWGPEGWKKIVVCVVADGREKCNPRARAVMSALGCYQDGVAVNAVDDKPVTAHLYEYTTQIGISRTSPTVSFAASDSSKHEMFPVQLLFCIKEKNAKKINSHRWFFDAFGPIIEPTVCILLDAGTKPGSDSLYHLWLEFYRNQHVGGACGEIRADLGKAGKNLINPLVAAQNFEYKMSNILDKPLESAFGFISVLPGAFSAYRYIALQNDVNGQGPLEKYFKGETLHSNAGIFTANMYLAEDRILCFELVAKRGASWVLRYVNSAHAETDVPDRLPELVLQRRRWLNGSFFAALYSITHMFSLWRSRHSFLRKIMLHVEFIYQTFSMLFSWFGIGNFFLVFRLLTSSVGSDEMNFPAGRYLGVVFEWLYLGCLVTCFVLSFGNKPKGTKIVYYIMVVFFAVLMVYLGFAVVFISVKAVQAVEADKAAQGTNITVKDFFTNDVLRGIVVSLGSTYVLYLVASFMFFEFGHMFHSFLQYLLLSPSYVNVLNVYAFCNIHDISWGTKGDTGTKTDLGVAKTTDTGQIKIALPTKPSEIDSAYLANLDVIKDKAVEKPDKPTPEEKEKDYYALVRSVVVLVWMLSNFIIVAVVLQTAGISRLGDSSSDNSDTDATARYIADTYLKVILWAVAAMAAVRFVGATWYLISRFF
ncbi:chitin synthase-domain-containing protein [Lipomyces tetrasporus]|uniref:chitin synthase n=1 Tax=Lipomyces tetrasporus TaxID=54092 RepID=A0AAD7VQD8_9ASCO|nr:chitin synthase-domain-containing protein [Lipomyces tetrasporus]KAJ8097494.1 chitin synthase-domain-containing protein [Lipomyces tetrasporus]